MIAEQLGVTIDKLRTDYVTADAIRFELDRRGLCRRPALVRRRRRPTRSSSWPTANMRDALIAAIAALPEREAQVIQLYYVEELNLEEIGAGARRRRGARLPDQGGAHAG